MALIPQFYKDSVVAIGVEISNNICWCATGFLVARKHPNGGYNTFLVTNKHVFEDEKGFTLYKSIKVRFNLKGKNDAKDYILDLLDSNNKKIYSTHPNKKIDIASVLINSKLLKDELGGISAFVLESDNALSLNEMKNNDIEEGSVVYMLGFPSGIVGAKSKVPLCRMGCISRVSEPYDDYSYLIDIQNFPGSSGSPIINKLESSYLTNSNLYNKTSLIGIVSAYIPYQDKLISEQTGKVMEIINENSGLAIVYPVDSIKETVECEFNRANDLIALQSNDIDPIVSD